MRLFRNICLWLCATAFLSPFIYAFFFCYPRGDDFDSVTRSMFLFDLPGGIYEICREWLTWSGRYTYHFLAVFLGKAAESRFACGIVCASVPALCWLAIRALPVREGGGAFFATLAITTLFACHGCLQNFYLFTDSLTICLQGAAFLVFFAFLCSLHENLRENNVDKANVTSTRSAIAAIFAIGVYEHAALAVFWTSLCALCLALMRQLSGFSRPLESPKKYPARLYARIFIFCCAALLFSFLAPGNFNRNHARGIDASSQLSGLVSAGSDWLHVCGAFFTSLWIPCIALLVLMRRFMAKDGTDKSAGNLCLCLLPPFACALFTFSAACLHAISDVSLPFTPKLGASIHFYMAIAWGVVLWNVPLPGCAIKFRPLWAVLALGLFIILASSGNLQKTFASAASGQMLELASSMEARRGYLLSISDKFPPEPFGLYGEAAKPDIRKRAVDASRPLVIVQSISPPVFPVYMEESLARGFSQWPNLWAAWMWGCGAIKSSPPAPQNAILKVISGNAMELSAQGEEMKGLDGAWRVSATGGPNSTFADDWLVLRGFKGKTITVMKPARPDWLRLMPLPLQYYCLDKLAANKAASVSFFMNLSGIFFHFDNCEATDGWLALPLGLTSLAPQYLFASFDGLTYYRLQPFFK